MVKSHGSHCKFKGFLLVNNINQKELAEKLGKSHSFINNALMGEVHILHPKILGL